MASNPNTFGGMSMRPNGLLLMSLLWLAASSVVLAEGCPPAPYSAEQLLELRDSGFEVEDDEQRNSLAVSLLACLSNPDPLIRDGVVFEGETQWMRNNELTVETLGMLYANLFEQLGANADTDGFQQPFAALLLSEVAHTDRVEPWFSDQMRVDLAALAASYLASVSDYRGYSETEGWRHGVAHGSDLVLQLVLNPAIKAQQVELLMKAVAIQIAPPGDVFYIYGEPARLARAVFYAYARELLGEAWWKEWFERVSSPGSLDSWGSAFSSQAGLARRHNTLAFLMAMHFNASSAAGEQAEVLDTLAVEAIARVLGG